MSGRARHGVFHFEEPVSWEHLTKSLNDHHNAPKPTTATQQENMLRGSMVHVFAISKGIVAGLRLPVAELSAESCYLVLHTHGEIPLEDSCSLDTYQAVAKLGFAAALVCTERSVGNRISNGSCYNIYLWVGKKAPNASKSTGTTMAFQLGTILSSSDDDSCVSVHSKITTLGRVCPLDSIGDTRSSLGSAQLQKLVKQNHLLNSVESLFVGKRQETFRSLNFRSPRVGTLSRRAGLQVKDPEDNLPSVRSGASSTSTATTSTAASSRTNASSFNNGTRSPSAAVRGQQTARAATMRPKQVEPRLPVSSAPFRSRSLLVDKSPKRTPSTDAARRQTPTISTMRTSTLSTQPQQAQQQQQNGGKREITRKSDTTAFARPRATNTTTANNNSKLRLSAVSQGRNSGSPTDKLSGRGTPKSPALNLNNIKTEARTNPAASTYTSEKSVRHARRQQLAESSPKCDEITPVLFLSGDEAARNKDLLKSVGITHILNVAAPNCANYHPTEFVYRSLFLSDNSTCDIESTFYDMIDFINSGIETGGKVLVHCFQGVSRSASAVIAFLMVSEGYSYEDALALVVSRRPIAKPNPYFMHQLIGFQERLRGTMTAPRLYELAPQSNLDPTYIVPRAVRNPTVVPSKAFRTVSSVSLLFDACFVLQCEDHTLFLWEGSGCTEEHRVRAHQLAERLKRFEHAERVIHLREGEETSEFWQHFEDLGKGFDPKARSQQKETTPSLQPTIEDNLSTNESDDTTEHTTEMWEWPTCEDLGALFDTDDLIDDGIFVLFDRANPKTRGLFVWVGQDSDLADKGTHDAKKAGLDVIRAAELQDLDVSDVHVVHQGNEADNAEFWTLFHNG